MIDLFNTPILLGLQAISDFVSTPEETALTTTIDATPLAPFRFQG